LIIFFITIIISLIYNSPILARNTNSIVTPVFPIRGHEFWPLTDPSQTPYTNFKLYYELINDNNFTATWLFRYDALLDDQITSTARQLRINQQLGLFLEITPLLAQAAQVDYPVSDGWSAANRVFISGYSLNDRTKLIDTVMSEFLKKYGHFPMTIGSWHIDAWSANYLSQHYGVNSIIICSDQYATDRYQIWGGWWGVPYYPSKNNILIPAQTIDNRLPITVSHWAARDPLIGYGGSVHQSTYSVQANDYLLHGLTTDYFEYLLNIYTQNPDNQFGYMLIGIENDYDIKQYGPEVSNQLSVVSEYQKDNKLTTITVSEFSQWYQQTFPDLSPKHVITTEFSPPYQGGARGGRETVTSWEMTSHYRLGYATDRKSVV